MGTSYWVAACADALQPNITRSGPGAGAPSCPLNADGSYALNAAMVLPAAVASDGSVGVGTIACDTSGINPVCLNGVTSGTTACGTTGQPGCGPVTTVIGTAEPIDYTLCGEFYGFGFSVVAIIYFSCLGIGEVLKAVRRV